MLASQTPTLQKIVAAVNAARAQSQSDLPGVRLDQANFTFPDGRSVVLVWDEAAKDYIVTAEA